MMIDKRCSKPHLATYQILYKIFQIDLFDVRWLLQGWVDNFNGPTGLFAAVSKWAHGITGSFSVLTYCDIKKIIVIFRRYFQIHFLI